MSSLNIPAKLLVIARSARMLAQMAVDSGFIPVAIDCFADLDTRQLSLDSVRVASLGFADLMPALNAMREIHGLTHVVYGSGFEAFPESLAFLQQDWVVLGNPAEVFRSFQNKSAFFGRLAALFIPYPETVFSPPDIAGNWLVKPMRGEGGLGIRWHEAEISNNVGECYWQRFIDGETYSALFVATEGQARILGFNRQWSAAIDDEHPFLFAGIVSHADLSFQHRALIGEWLAKLVSVYPLVGLGSLDFIVAKGCCYLLEINARVPASAQLYGKVGFDRHLQASLGVLDDGGVEASQVRAYQIIYAKQPFKIAKSVDWPCWAVDRPDGGAIVGKGQPICSIIAAGKSPGEAVESLRCRQQFIENFLITGS